MLTGPVAAARAAVATGAWVQSKHGTYLIHGSVELELYFYPSAGGLKRKKKKQGAGEERRGACAGVLSGLPNLIRLFLKSP